jgi:hypothetical protein
MISKRKDLDRVRNTVEVRCSIEMGTDGRQMQAQPTRQERWRCGSVNLHEDAGMMAATKRNLDRINRPPTHWVLLDIASGY